MFEELAIMNGSRLMLLGGISYTLWQLHGVLWRGWSVGEVFFWSSWELVLSAASTAVLTCRWHQRVGRAHDAWKGVREVVSTSLIALLLGVAFTLLCLAQEGISVVAGTLSGYVLGRLPTMMLLAVLMLLLHLMIAHGWRLRHTTREQLWAPWANRLWPMLGTYAILILSQTALSHGKLDLSRRYLLILGGGMLGVKLCVELQQFFGAGKGRGESLASRC